MTASPSPLSPKPSSSTTRWLGTLLGRVAAGRFAYAIWTVAVVGFALFQKRMLPPRLARFAARFYFYPTLPLTYARLCLLPPRAGLWTPVDDTVIFGAAPVGFLGHTRRLAGLGVAAVVNCCDEYGGPSWTGKIEHLHIPTVDHVEPSPEDLEKAVRFIEDHKKRGHRVYVHCKAGHGRSAAVVYAWLLHDNYGKVAPFELFETIASKRRVRKDLWRQPNILSFYESLPLLTKKTGGNSHGASRHTLSPAAVTMSKQPRR